MNAKNKQESLFGLISWFPPDIKAVLAEKVTTFFRNYPRCATFSVHQFDMMSTGILAVRGLLSAGRAQTFEPNLLAVDDEAFVWAACHRERYFRQAGRVAAVCTGKMRMALALGAMVGQFEMPRSFLHKGPVYQPDPQQAFEGPVDCHFIEVFFARSPSDLVLAERPARFHQHFQYGRSAFSAVKLRRSQHLAGLRVQVWFHHHTFDLQW